jgi:hypothetical protein
VDAQKKSLQSKKKIPTLVQQKMKEIKHLKKELADSET